MSFMTTLRREFPPDNLVSSVSVGLVSGIMNLTIMFALATLVFSGDLSAFVPRGLGLLLMSCAVLCTVLALGSSVPTVFATSQDSPAAIMALVALALSEAMAGAGENALFATTVAALTLTALGTGLVFFLIGWFNLGNLVRFIPFPVIGGFMAGTGVLLLEGGVSIMADVPVSPTDLDAFTDLDLIARWLPGVVFAILLTLVLRRHNHALLVPAALAVAAAIFFVVLAITGTSMAEATEQGWLLEKFEAGSGGLWQPLSRSDWEAVDWDALAAQAGNFVSISIVSVIALLLNATGLELAIERDVNLNRELKIAGIANVILGLGGGLVGYHVLGGSVLAHRMGARSRLSGLILALVFVLALFVGGSMLVYFPKLALGGLVLFLAIDFLVVWVFETWARLPKIDFAIILLIMAVIERIGFLEGIALGMVVSVILFVVNYSRIDVIKHTLTGQTYRSAVLRPRHQGAILDRHGEELVIFKLQGFVFFGTANRLLDEVRACLDNPEGDFRRCVLLDFQAVTGLDSSATLSFTKMRQLAQQHGATLILTALSPEICQQLQPDVITGADDVLCRTFVDMDHGVEWAEGQILAAHHDPAAVPPGDDFGPLLESTLTDASRALDLLNYLAHDDVEAGAYLVRQGDPPRGLIFIQRGSITIQLEREDAPPVRLRRVTDHTFVGEIGLYLDQPATASVVADGPARISVLTPDALRRMEADDPELASALHRFMARSLAERVTQTTNTLNALID